MKDRGILTSYMLTLFSKINDPEYNSQYKLLEDCDSIRVNDFSINNTLLTTLFDNLLKFHDTDKKFELEGEFLKKVTNKNYNVDLADLPHKKLTIDFTNEKYSDGKSFGNKNSRDKLP